MDYMPHVVQAVPGEGRTVYAYFSDGSVRLTDVSHLIVPGTVFDALKDERFFRERLTVINGAVAWDVSGDRDATTCIDLDPFNMYETSAIVRDPLVERESCAE